MEKGRYVVVVWEARVSYRFEPYGSTTVYMDEEVASFDTEQEAKDFIRDNEIRLEEEWILERFGSIEAYNQSFYG